MVLQTLAQGEGYHLTVLEIKWQKKGDYLKSMKLLLHGPSMSVLMEGYQDKNTITSLRGTLVPGKTLNNIISKIPVIGIL